MKWSDMSYIMPQVWLGYSGQNYFVSYLQNPDLKKNNYQQFIVDFIFPLLFSQYYPFGCKLGNRELIVWILPS